MKNFTNVSLFPENYKLMDDELRDSLLKLVKEKLSTIPQLIEDAYTTAVHELSNKPIASVRGNSRAMRVNEEIAGFCSETFPENFMERGRKFMLYFPGICQIHIIKLNKGIISPRKTKTAKNEVRQQKLPFDGCPIIHIGHDYSYGHTSSRLMYHNGGKCVWSCLFSDILESKHDKPLVTINQSINNRKEVFAKPKIDKIKKITKAI